MLPVYPDKFNVVEGLLVHTSADPLIVPPTVAASTTTDDVVEFAEAHTPFLTTAR